MSLHIGCHWKGILLRVCNLFEMNRGTKGIKAVSRIIAGLLAVFGVVFSFQKDIGRKLLWNSSMKTMRPDMAKPDFSPADKNEFRNAQPDRDMQHGKGKEEKQQISIHSKLYDLYQFIQCAINPWNYPRTCGIIQISTAKSGGKELWILQICLMPKTATNCGNGS